MDFVDFLGFLDVSPVRSCVRLQELWKSLS